MPEPLFRFAETNDTAEIAALIERAYRGPEAAGRWYSEGDLMRGPRTSLAEVAGLIADRNCRFVVAELDGSIAGCALIQNRSVGEAYFGMFAIDPGRIAAGLGKAVLADAERQARLLWGARSIVMTVINLRTVLIEWYERRGYRLTGARLAFPFTATTGETRRDFDLVEMRKDF